ncbi:uncharacterized protein EV154DRAFT_502358 [Mucor mucedo]|uniref:uncharacterized protein n=1 Tax=Mucor mucedo TaxID=29922 RepID=UPI00221F3B23|nr:uncharacterized protein EV154DRAFT_502358 [Mucor mucedo]KAI7893297.1 hypothetical protein EV154DRAFT_502358 [Mucor mucedo]
MHSLLKKRPTRYDPKAEWRALQALRANADKQKEGEIDPSMGKNASVYNIGIGIDFGTYFSRVSYTFACERNGERNPEVEDIWRWPRNDASLSLLPTRLLYEKGVMIKWGNFRKIRSQEEEATLFKLYLDETNHQSIPSLPSGVTTLHAVSDYLKAIFDYTYSSISRNYGKYVDQSKVRVCLTVPGHWSDRSIDLLKDAVVLAGIFSRKDLPEKLLLVPELDVAALYCEAFVPEYNPKDGDTVMICKIEEGIAEFAVHRVYTDENGENSLSQEVPFDRAMFSSETIDMLFKNFVSEKMEEISKKHNVESLRPYELDDILKHFREVTKHSVFSLNHPEYDEDGHFIILPCRYDFNEAEVDAGVYISDCHLFISSSEMIANNFDPFIDRLLNLIVKQFERFDSKINNLLVVGSDADYEYVQEILKERLHGKVGQVIIPPRLEMYNSRGAALMASNPRTIKVKSGRFYGYECSLEFDERLDPLELRCMTKEGVAYCNQRFQLYYIRSSAYDTKDQNMTSFQTYCNKNPTIQLFEYEGSLNQVPRHTTHEDVKKLASVEIELPHMPYKKPTDTVDVNVQIELDGIEIKFWVTIMDQVQLYSRCLTKDTKIMIGELL